MSNQSIVMKLLESLLLVPIGLWGFRRMWNAGIEEVGMAIVYVPTALFGTLLFMALWIK